MAIGVGLDSGVLLKLQWPVALIGGGICRSSKLQASSSRETLSSKIQMNGLAFAHGCPW
jgi:hypothetical protein